MKRKTTKGKKQLDTMYAGMKPEHRLRHRISTLHDKVILDPMDRAVIKLAEIMLKGEEINGNGWLDSLRGKSAWDSFKAGFEAPFQAVGWLTKKVDDYPIAKTAVEFAFPETAPYIKGASKAGKVIRGLMPLDSTSDVVSPNSKFNPTERVDDLVAGIQSKTQDSDQQAYTTPVEAVDDKGDNINPLKHPDLFIDSSIRFPIVYNYDENERPMNLQDWLIQNGVAGANFSDREFGNVYLNQRPYEFLNHPLNGGALGKISYQKLVNY
jgi:hypothetical protein